MHEYIDAKGRKEKGVDEKVNKKRNIIELIEEDLDEANNILAEEHFYGNQETFERD